MPHANHSHGPHIRILRVPGKRLLGRNCKGRLNLECRLYSAAAPLLQSPSIRAARAGRKRRTHAFHSLTNACDFAAEMWRASGGRAGLPLAQAKRAESRINCMQLRHARDILHESRAWTVCSIVSGGICELRLCSRQQKEETGNACGVVEAQLREMTHGLRPVQRRTARPCDH
jgi:hypothetical protein